MLEIRDLVSGYGKSEVLRGINLEVQEGQIVTIIGPNGAGKTTLFRTIFGLLPARQGKVLFENEDLTKMPPLARIKKGITLVPQGRNVFPDLNVLENMEMGAYTVKNKEQISSEYGRVLPPFPGPSREKKAKSRHTQRRRTADAGPLPGRL